MGKKDLARDMAGMGIIDAINYGLSVQSTDYKILYQNKKAEEMIGPHLGEYCYKAFEKRERICPDCPLEKSFMDGQSYTVERSGPVFERQVIVEVTTSPLRDSSGQIIAGVEVVKDITGRREIEAEVMNSEKEYRGLMNNSLVGVTKATLKGDIIYVNDALARIYGFNSPEEVKKHNVRDLYKNPEDGDKFIKELKTRGLISNYELDIVTKSGKTINILVNANLEGDVITGMIMDITKFKLAEEELRASQAELELRVMERTVQFEETNTALKVLMAQMHNEKNEIEKNILSNMRNLVFPYIEKLRNIRTMSKQFAYLNILESNLKEVVSPFSHKLSSKFNTLTPREVRVAGLIKDGRQDKDIAAILGISAETVKSHRRSIREKLKLKSTKINLRTYLLSMTK